LNEDIHFRLPGKYNLKNTLGAIALARYAGFSPAEIKAGIEAVRPLFGRAEVFRGRVTVMLDCYNANPDSMESALDFCKSLEWNGRKLYVLGSMLELGAESADAHRKVCELAAVSGAESLSVRAEMVEAGRVFMNGKRPVLYRFDELSRAVAETVQAGDFVFIKGSRGMALERIQPALNVNESGGAHG
jgi:UDP-N-acetylmuramoyl-tripeptide--D-alanyl-D-alanine ligase